MHAIKTIIKATFLGAFFLGFLGWASAGWRPHSSGRDRTWDHQLEPYTVFFSAYYLAL